MTTPEENDGIPPLVVEELALLQACQDAIVLRIKPKLEDPSHTGVVSQAVFSELAGFAKKYEEFIRRKHSL